MSTAAHRNRRIFSSNLASAARNLMLIGSRANEYSQGGRPPRLHSAHTYGPRRRMTCRPLSCARRRKATKSRSPSPSPQSNRPSRGSWRSQNT
eukprot:scaffold3_cov273-Pinguiococcus_pyrenoidosus.AAC.12